MLSVTALPSNFPYTRCFMFSRLFPVNLLASTNSASAGAENETDLQGAFDGVR